MKKEIFMKKIWKTMQPWFLYFLMYAIVGWAYEVFLEVVVYQWGY